MTHAIITTLPGDGIGPEIVEQGLNVLEAVAKRFQHQWTIHEALIGGAAIDSTGVPLPPETLSTCRASDAILLGAVGGPKWDTVAPDIRPERGLLAIRKALGLYANLRPICVFPELAEASPLKPARIAGVDFVVVRELTGGIYFGDKTLTAHDTGERASDECAYTTAEVERVVRLAATLARQRRGRLASVDKANVLETSRLWRRVVTRILRDEFPDVTCEHVLVDTCAMQLINRPAAFDVIVTENMFGDILTDEASVLTGSIGLLPSASLNDSRVGLYEPIHGSAPDIAGKGIANPIGTILSVAMLLRYSLSLHQEAQTVESAVSHVIGAGYRTADLSPEGSCSTAEIGAAIVEHILTADTVKTHAERREHSLA